MREAHADDTVRALNLWVALGGVGDPRSVVVYGPPERKQRPRLGGDHVYAPDAEAEADTARQIIAGLRPVERGLLPGNVALVCLLYRQNAQVIDADNLAKHVMDAGNGVLWFDDRQVTGLAVLVELDREAPRSVIVFGGHYSTMVREAKVSPPRARVAR